MGQKFEVEAKAPAGTTTEQFHGMLQNMLAQRFGLVIHHETTMLQVFYPAVAENGPRLQFGGSTQNTEVAANSSDKDGFPLLHGTGLAIRYGPGVTYVKARQQTIQTLSGRNGAARHIIDKTGLTDKYDFNLQYDMDTPGPRQTNSA